MAETRNFGTYNKKDLKTIPGHADGRGTADQPNPKTNLTKNPKNKLQKSTESIKRTKLEDLKQEAHVAQRSREEREDERRKRIEELRMRNNDRRSRVEERKRLIFEAEREKQEAILRKNQEIEARMEARRNKEKEEKKKKKKSEKSSTPVAFGSSTPRMLCLNDTNGSFCSSCWAMAREHDSSKKQASMIIGGHGRKFNEGSSNDGRSERSSSNNFQTTNKCKEQVRGIRTPRNGSTTLESVCSSNIKVFARLSRNNDGEMTSASRSRSNSSMSQQSGSTDSLDSCNVKLRPRAIINRQRRPIVNYNTSVSVKVNHLSSDIKLTPVRSPLLKVHSTPKESSISKSSEIKKRLTTETSRVKEEEEQRLMEETMRIASEMLEVEKERLQITIEETKRWEEDEQRKQEEKARKKREKEEAEKKAMEKAEKQRVEFFERLKKSEEERLARRKRVEIIMLRTRG